MSPVSRIRLLLPALVLCGLTAPLAAQDAQYWTNQYGNEARLLGGAVIGSVFDLSAVFYNPGRLALVTDPRLVLAGNVFRASRIKIEDAFGNGKDLTNTKIGGVPSLFAGELRFKFLGSSRLAYSFLTRQDFDFEVSERLDLRGAQVPDPGVDLFAAGFLFNQNMDEYWAGLTWAHTLGKKMGLGVTTFLAVRDQKSRRQTLAQAVDTAGNAGIALQQEGYQYQHWRLLWKIGLGGDFGNWDLGLSVTTPSVAIMGSGRAAYDQTLINQDINGSGTSSDVTTSTQTDLPVSYKSPLSVGVGAAYRKGSARIHVSAEWYDAVPAYDVLAPDPVILPDSTMAVFGLVQELNSVTNFSVGAEYQFGPKLTGYVGFRTDQSAIDAASSDNTSLALWDIYHVSGGGTFSVGASDFTVGGIVAWGSDVTRTGIDFLPGGGGPVDIPDQLQAKFFRFTFILGFSIGF